jgi:hypothetical protein
VGQHWLIAASGLDRWAQAGSWELAAQHGQLMTKHEDLQILGGIAAGEQGQGSWMAWRSIR